MTKRTFLHYKNKYRKESGYLVLIKIEFNYLSVIINTSINQIDISHFIQYEKEIFIFISFSTKKAIIKEYIKLIDCVVT